MNKFKFVNEQEMLDGSIVKRTVEFEAESFEEVLEQYELFLLACGFKFSGNVDIIEDID